MERTKRGKKRQKRKLLGSHQRCWLWGRNLITEILEAGRWDIAELYLADDLPSEESQRAQVRADQLGVAVKVEDAGRLTELGSTSEHQGYLARMYDYPYADPQDLLASLPSPALAVVMDRVQDPHNFGAIVRSAEVLGAGGIFIAQRNQTPVTSLTARSSTGAVNRIGIARVDDLPEWCAILRDRGLSVVAAQEGAATLCPDHDFTVPTAIVLGNEGRGIRDEVLAHCDACVAVPQQGRVGSLNVAAAAAVLLYETCRQRRGKG